MMIESKLDAAIEQIQQLERAEELQVRITGGSGPAKIEHLAPLTRTEKLRLRFANGLRVKTIAYGLSAVVALAAGQAVQNLERHATGYDPMKRELLLERRAQKID